MISKAVASLKGLSEQQWVALCRRIESGMATLRDARHVEEVGLMPQAIRIRQGLACHSDAVLVHLQVQIRMHGPALLLAEHQGAAA